MENKELIGKTFGTKHGKILVTGFDYENKSFTSQLLNRGYTGEQLREMRASATNFKGEPRR